MAATYSNIKSLHIHKDEEPTDDLQFDDVDEPMVFEPNQADEELDHSTSTSPSRQTQMEEVEDGEAGGIRRYVEDYGRSAGHVYGEGQSQFMKWREAQKNAGHAPWSPYNDLDEWDLSQWLIHNVEDKNGETRIFDEMWTGDWWWNMQVSYLSWFL